MSIREADLGLLQHPKRFILDVAAALDPPLHTSFRYVKSDPTTDSIFPFTIDHRPVTSCRETNNYWSNPTRCFLPYSIRLVNTGFWDIKLQIVK